MDEKTKKNIRIGADLIGSVAVPMAVPKITARIPIVSMKPGDIPESLSSLAGKFKKTRSSFFDSGTGEIEAFSSPSLAHELGHKKIYETVGAPIAESSMYGLYGMLKMPYLLSPILSDTVMDAVKGKDEESRRYRAADWVERNRGKTIALAAAPGLLHEAAASIIGAKLIKEHTNIPVAEYAKELAGAWGSYALPAAAIAAYGAYKSHEYDKEHPTEKVANPMLYAHLLDDAAIIGTRLYNSNQINVPKIKKPQSPFTNEISDYLDPPEEPKKPKVIK